MKFLTNHGVNKEDTYTFDITRKDHIRDEVVSVTFINGEFDQVILPFSSPYNREDWKILIEIEERISAIEKNYASKICSGPKDSECH